MIPTPKLKRRVRPIDVLNGTVSPFWARERREEALECERLHDQDFFAAREGNGTLDTVRGSTFTPNVLRRRAAVRQRSRRTS